MSSVKMMKLICDGCDQPTGHEISEEEYMRDQSMDGTVEYFCDTCADEMDEED